MKLVACIFLLVTLFAAAQPSAPTGFALQTINTMPSPSTTGVPAGTTLTNYTGSCSITVNNTVIDSKTLNCTVEIRAQNVTIRNSQITGSIEIYTDEGIFTGGSANNSLLIEDSRIIGPSTTTYFTGVDGVGEKNWVARRIHVTGFRRQMHCLRNCTLEHSLLHQVSTVSSPETEPTATHQSAIRGGPNFTLRGNVIHCDAPDVGEAGCSSNLTIYNAWGPQHDILIEGNYFPASTAGYCTYGGDSHNTPDSYNVIFRNNYYGRRGKGNSVPASAGSENGGPTCGYYGSSSAFTPGRPGNVWTNNVYVPDGGTVVGQ